MDTYIITRTDKHGTRATEDYTARCNHDLTEYLDFLTFSGFTNIKAHYKPTLREIAHGY